MSHKRALSAALVAAITSNSVRLLNFVKLEFDSGTVYVHDGVGSYTWDSQTWTGLGDLAGVGSLQEGVELSPYELRLTLSGLDASLMDEILNQDYYLRAVTLYRGAIDITTGDLVADPSEVWYGTMDTATISAGANNGIALINESEFSILDRVNGRTYSDADLQTEYPGDKWCEFVPSLQDAKLVWHGRPANVGGYPPLPLPPGVTLPPGVHLP